MASRLGKSESEAGSEEGDEPKGEERHVRCSQGGEEESQLDVEEEARKSSEDAVSLVSFGTKSFGPVHSPNILFDPLTKFVDPLYRNLIDSQANFFAKPKCS